MKIPLTNVCDFQGGSQPPKEEWIDHEASGYVRMLQIRDFTQAGKNNIEYVKDGKNLKKCTSDDILIGRYGASVGKVLSGLSGAYNVAIIKAIPNDARLTKRYLYYYLNSDYFQNYILSVGSRAAQAGFNKDDLEGAIIPLFDIPKQIDIVALLDMISNLISLRKQQLAKLDELVKARFVELFGDMAHSNNKICLEEISDFVTVGIANSATHAYADSGVVMLRNQNIKENYLDENDLIYITPDFAQKYGSKQLAENDILVIRTGYPGVACLVPKKYEGCQTFTTLIVRLKDSTLAHANYVCHYINSSFGKDYVEQSKVGVAQQNFGAKALAKMPIVVPPIELQEQFATFVEQTDKSKLSIQQSLDKLELLKKALMQKYFG